MRQLGWWALCLVGCLGACADPEGRRVTGEMNGDAGNDSGYVDPEPEPEPEPMPDAEPMENPDAAMPGDAGGEEVVDGGGTDKAPEPNARDAGQVPRPDVKADAWAVTTKNRLVRFERASGSVQRAVRIAGLAEGEQLVGADVRPADGQLYALAVSGKLYRVDAESGAASLAATLRADPADTTSPFAALSGKRFGVDWNPVVDRLRVVSDAGENLRIDAASGNTTTDTAMGTRALVAAAYTQSFAAACRTRLLVIDAGERSLLLQDPPNLGALSPIGGLGTASFDEVTAFEIQTAPDGTDRGLVAATRGDATVLLDVDLARGTAERPRSLALEAGERTIGLGMAPPAGEVRQQPGEFTGLTENERLITFNRGTPSKLCSATAVTGLPEGERLLGIDVRPADGELYGLGKAGALYKLSRPDARASLGGSLLADVADTSDRFSALPGPQLGSGWNPVADRLRVLGANGQNLRVNPATGATTTDAALSGVADLGPLEAAYTNSFAGTRSTTLFALSAAQGLVRIGGDPASGGACEPPNPDAGNPNCGVVRAIGPLGVAGVQVHGFDIDGKTGAAWAVLGSGSASALYSVDLTSGKAGPPLGTVGGGQALRSFTLTRDPMARGVALTRDARLLTFDLKTPAAPMSSVALTGEKLLGIDVRAADGKLYAFGASGTLYTLDREGGTLAAVGGKASTLGASAYGVDWNPVADALRVVGSDGSNLRLPGAMLDMPAMDGALNPGTPAVVAAAYNRNYAGSMATTLYVIDSSSDFLLLQGGTWGAPSPNTGTLTPVGALGVDAQGDVAFDIVGGHDGLAIAAIRTTGDRSELYSVDLARGWATPLNMSDNAIGASGSAPVVGIAVDLR